jgi:hypothetical protein
VVIWAGFFSLVALALVRFRSRAGYFLFLAALFLTPFLGELLVSLFRPIFYERTLIWATLPLYVLVAIGITQLRYKTYILTILIMLVTLDGLSLSNYFISYEKERWDLAAAYVDEKIQPGDVLLFNAGWSEIPFDYYFSRYGHKADEFGAPETMFEFGELEPRMQPADLPRLRTILKGRARVWLIYSHNWWTDPRSLVQGELRSSMRLREVKNFYGMQIQLYESR